MAMSVVAASACQRRPFARCSVNPIGVVFRSPNGGTGAHRLDERLLEFVLGKGKDLLPGGVYAWLVGQGELQCLGERP